MEVMKNVELKYENGKAIILFDVKAELVKLVEGMEAKIASGEIDLIPGTKVDDVLLGQLLTALKAAV